MANSGIGRCFCLGWHIEKYGRKHTVGRFASFYTSRNLKNLGRQPPPCPPGSYTEPWWELHVPCQFQLHEPWGRSRSRVNFSGHTLWYTHFLALQLTNVHAGAPPAPPPESAHGGYVLWLWDCKLSYNTTSWPVVRKNYFACMCRRAIRAMW